MIVRKHAGVEAGSSGFAVTGYVIPDKSLNFSKLHLLISQVEFMAVS